MWYSNIFGFAEDKTELSSLLGDKNTPEFMLLISIIVVLKERDWCF